MELKKNQERPLDCGSCKKQLTTKYTEVADTVVNEYYMCSTCPFLNEFLSKPKVVNSDEVLTNLTCGTCGVSLLDIQRGGFLGCVECYSVFEIYLANSLKEEHKIQMGIDLQGPLHLGHKPGEFKEFDASVKIFALNETLNELIHREDFEQAASIRDQIKELKKKQKNNG
ncbi:MAG: hypothetical protein S4CHLAM7_08230 [Chlamydiae bacterium]|nr:hypothetical protein [Chlamydiota bacterium]